MRLRLPHPYPGYLFVVRIAGVDGCRSGWVVVTCVGHRLTDLTVVTDAEELWSLDVDRIAIDIPIGLPDSGARACDRIARTALGPRRSSVFPAPCRPVLGARSYDEALALSRRVSGVGLSRQSWHLLPKIRQIDERISPADQGRVTETHPELAFARLAGGPLPTPKRHPEGRAVRASLLGRAGWVLPQRVPGAAADDLADAAALALATSLGLLQPLGDGSTDGRGLRMEIWG